MTEATEQDSPAMKRERSPSFPYIDLGTAIEHLEKIYTVAKMNEVRFADTADAWGMTATSGSLMRYVAALGQFDLIDTSGSGDKKRIKVSALGRRILEDNRPGVRENLCSEAALLPKLVRGLFLGEDNMPHWGKDRPSDSIAESSLKFDLGFGNDAARRFLMVYDATIKHVVDTATASNGVDNVGDMALESQKQQPDFKVETMHSHPHDAPSKKQLPVDIEGALNDIDFQNAGKGKIKISAVLDSEGLDILEKKIAAFRMLIN